MLSFGQIKACTLVMSVLYWLLCENESWSLPLFLLNINVKYKKTQCYKLFTFFGLFLPNCKMALGIALLPITEKLEQEFIINDNI